MLNVHEKHHSAFFGLKNYSHSVQNNKYKMATRIRSNKPTKFLLISFLGHLFQLILGYILILGLDLGTILKYPRQT